MYGLARRLAGVQRVALISFMVIFLPQLTTAQPAQLSSTVLRASEAYFLLPPPGRTLSAGFMRLENHTDSEAMITAWSSPLLERVELHGHARHGGMVQMRRAESLHIAPHSEQLLAPGGYHLMLYGLPSSLAVGDSVVIDLQLSSGESLRVDVVARSRR